MKTLVATSAIVTERPDGTFCLTISSQNETIVFEFSAELWKCLAESAKWFHALHEDVVSPSEEIVPSPVIAALDVDQIKMEEPDVQVQSLPEVGLAAEEDRR
jgi:hypothetical protein